MNAPIANISLDLFRRVSAAQARITQLQEMLLDAPITDTSQAASLLAGIAGKKQQH